MQLWITEHREFHQLCSARAEGPLAEIILSYSERSERYLRYAQNTHPRTFATARVEHERILRLIKAGDADGASALMASHLAKTAMLVLEGLGVETKDGVVRAGADDGRREEAALTDPPRPLPAPPQSSGAGGVLDQENTVPPSTMIVCPLMNPLAGEHRKVTIPVRSSGAMLRGMARCLARTGK